MCLCIHNILLVNVLGEDSPRTVALKLWHEYPLVVLGLPLVVWVRIRFSAEYWNNNNKTKGAKQP